MFAKVTRVTPAGNGNCDATNDWGKLKTTTFQPCSISAWTTLLVVKEPSSVIKPMCPSGNCASKKSGLGKVLS